MVTGKDPGVWEERGVDVTVRSGEEVPCPSLSTRVRDPRVEVRVGKEVPGDPDRVSYITPTDRRGPVRQTRIRFDVGLFTSLQTVWSMGRVSRTQVYVSCLRCPTGRILDTPPDPWCVPDRGLSVHFETIKEP